ncbi:MAG: hypothetical protein MUC76_02145 [Spirochaetes bacterium]|nr:hypothetical protein [Spirochaetota bacterium]
MNHAKKTVTFRYKSWCDVRTKGKSYKTATRDIYEFMAKMLYFLSKKHQKIIRYFAIAGIIWTSCPLPAGGHRDRTTLTVPGRS